MRNFGQKLFIILPLLFILFSISFKVYSQNENELVLAEFFILVETTDNGVKFTSEKGCAWSKLSFSLTQNQKQLVDHCGMTSEESHKCKAGSKSNCFLFSVERTESGLSFEGKLGTAWKELSFSCPENKCHQYINQYGMTKLE